MGHALDIGAWREAGSIQVVDYRGRVFGEGTEHYTRGAYAPQNKANRRLRTDQGLYKNLVYSCGEFPTANRFPALRPPCPP
jgi:hypothetical protein